MAEYGEWNRKGATLSDKTARKEYGLSQDEIIEAIESPDSPWLVCVQWHPELTAAEDPLQQRLFDDLVNRAGKQKA